MKLSNILVASLILPISLLASSPLAPSNLILKAQSANSILISWNDNSTNELGFKIWRDGALIKTVPANIKTFIDTGLSPNTNYNYEVRSTDDTIDEPTLSNVHINEILASNKDVKLDPDFFEFSDYIELRNYENHSVDIGGYTISDDKKSWSIPSSTSIAANGYLLIWADEKNIKKKALHANFKLSSKKEKVTLKDRSGNVVDNVSYKKLPSNTSVRVVSGNLVYMSPTPASNNQKVYTKLTKSDKPSFSKNSGFYNSAQSITLASSNGAKIYYTLDGSTPTINSTRYTSAITVSTTSVIKAISLESGKVISSVESNSYIINFDTVLPTISLSIEDRYLFDDYVGIYTKGKNGVANTSCGNGDEKKNYARDWERPSYIEYFDKNHDNIFNSYADISISGQCSRENKKKSFSFELEDKLSYKLYDGKDLNGIKDFKTRTGHMSYQIQGILAASLVEDGNLNIDYQAYTITHLFVNGEYWGLYNIREKKGKDYLRSNYPDLGKKVDILNWSPKSGDENAHDELISYIQNHNLAVNSNYQHVISMIDEDNFIDYLSFMLYSANWDWLNSNFRCWKEKKDGAKWRWMLDDLDGGFSRYDDDTFDLIKKRDISSLAHLINAMMKNTTFKSKLKSRLNTMLDTTLLPSSVNSAIDEIDAKKAPYIHLEESKWSGKITRSKFDNHIDKMHEFANKRRDVMKRLINQYL